MSRYVKVSGLANSTPSTDYADYKIAVQSGGIIKLDTGDSVGTVVVTGNLRVDGTTTTVNTVEMNVEDRIITLNSGDIGPGVTGGDPSGIEVNRGLSFPKASFLFEESADDFWAVKFGDNLTGIRVSEVATYGGNLRLLGDHSGVSSVVLSRPNYEQSVLNYFDPNLTPFDDDIIPNIKAVTDYVTGYFTVNAPFKIDSFDSKLEISDFQESGSPSTLTLELDGTPAASWTLAQFNVQDLRLQDSTISSTSSNTDLTLISPGTGSVTIDDTLKLKLVVTDPTSDLSGIKVFAKTEGSGGSGLYFVNTKETKDELVSRRKALAFSMIF